MRSLAPKNWFQNDIEIQIRHVSPPSTSELYLLLKIGKSLTMTERLSSLASDFSHNALGIGHGEDIFCPSVPTLPETNQTS